MRLIISAGYRYLVFPSSVNLSAVVEAVGQAKLCETTGYGDDAIYTPVPDAIDIKLVPEDRLRVSDEPGAQNALADRVVELSKKNSGLEMKVYTLEAELKRIKAAAGAA